MVLTQIDQQLAVAQIWSREFSLPPENSSVFNLTFLLARRGRHRGVRLSSRWRRAACIYCVNVLSWIAEIAVTGAGELVSWVSTTS